MLAGYGSRAAWEDGSSRSWWRAGDVQHWCRGVQREGARGSKEARGGLWRARRSGQWWCCKTRAAGSGRRPVPGAGGGAVHCASLHVELLGPPFS